MAITLPSQTDFPGIRARLETQQARSLGALSYMAPPSVWIVGAAPAGALVYLPGHLFNQVAPAPKEGDNCWLVNNSDQTVTFVGADANHAVPAGDMAWVRFCEGKWEKAYIGT